MVVVTLIDYFGNSSFAFREWVGVYYVPEIFIKDITIFKNKLLFESLLKNLNGVYQPF